MTPPCEADVNNVHERIKQGAVSLGTVITKANEPTLKLCLLRIGLTVCTLQASTLSILLVAIDRVVAITCALRYQQIMTPRKAAVAIAATWIHSLSVGFAPLMGWSNPEYRNYCSFLFVLASGYVVFLFIVAFVPILVVFAIYIKLFRKARVHIRRIEALHNIGVVRSNSGPLGLSSHNWKSMKTLLVVIGCLVVTWCPFLILTAVQMTCGEPTCCLKNIIGTHLFILGVSNSFLNPIIYAIRTKEFRHRFRKLFFIRCSV
ncbi:5-hydroxytryptamine receptor 1A-like [Gigantopelta aegis]|uniref:5-hydroxytryptamine receptor 1A-like n=1 Tax=Gigantopelta aegis TaxID=1735272 RepID=UPI001B88B00A|nr:5-hydroxytryptamine receptor 1A-like [Gigantopelta aegis]